MFKLGGSCVSLPVIDVTMAGGWGRATRGHLPLGLEGQPHNARYSWLLFLLPSFPGLLLTHDQPLEGSSSIFQSKIWKR